MDPRPGIQGIQDMSTREEQLTNRVLELELINRSLVAELVKNEKERLS